ncbi:MAG: hypothetical protein ACTHU0_25790 [Kofleriaceae bacterium]
MAYFGSYYGVTPTVTVVRPPDPPIPVESPVPPSSPAYVDHARLAIDRLCQYAKTKLIR